MSDDVDQDTFYIHYGSTTARGVSVAGGGGFPTLSAAIAHVEGMPGFGKTVRWTMPTWTLGAAAEDSWQPTAVLLEQRLPRKVT